MRTELVEQCRRQIKSLYASYQWGLIEPDELLNHVLERLDEASSRTLRQTIISAYMATMHAAFLLPLSHHQAERAYLELQRYLTALSHRYVFDQTADIIEEALARIRDTAASCRKPEAFALFALQKLRDVARRYRRREQRMTSLEAINQQEGIEWTDSGPSVEEQIEHSALRDLLSRFWREHLRRYPRSSQQLSAIWMRYIQGLPVETIADHLQCSSEQVWTLLTRGRERLRNDPNFQTLAREFAIVDSYA